MNITPEIYAAHRELSRCSAAFLDYVQANPACLEAANFEGVLSTYFGYVKFHPWPTFIDEKTREKIYTAAVKVHQLITSIPGRLFANDIQKIMEYYRLPQGAVKMMLRGVGAVAGQEHPWDILSRGDFLYSAASGLKCLEFNMTSNVGGGWQADELEPFYYNTPVLARFLKEYGSKMTRTGFSASLLAHVVDRAAKHPPYDSDEEINTAVVYPNYGGSDPAGTQVVKRLKEIYQDVLRQEFPHRKGSLVVTDFFRLRIKNGCMLTNFDGEEKKIHVIVEKCNGVVPLSVMDVVDTSKVLLFNGPISHLMSSKLNLALLSEHENSDLFSPEEQQIIKTYIPWTRKVDPGLEDFVLSHRENLVLKPGDGIGGYGVAPGRNTPPDQWKQYVKKALEDLNWVVQEYVPSYLYLYQDGEKGAVEHHMVWGVFVFGSRGCGGFTRVLPAKHHKGVINASQGARLNIILEVAEY
jgi:hypothetical protein